MQASFTFEEPAPSLFFQVSLLIFGLLCFGLGLTGLAQAGAFLLEALAGEPTWPEHTGPVMLLILALLGFGGLFLWAFSVPSKKAVLDASAQTVHVVYQYPFRIRRDRVYALRDVDPPEIVWNRNSEYSDGGFWELKLTLPDGRSIVRTPNLPRTSDQLKQAEAWKTEIAAMCPQE